MNRKTKTPHQKVLHKTETRGGLFPHPCTSATDGNKAEERQADVLATYVARAHIRK